MKVDNNSERNVEYGLFDELEFNSPLTKEQYEMLINRKIERAKVYHRLFSTPVDFSQK